MTRARIEYDLIHARKALVWELETIRTTPKNAPDARPAIPAIALFTDLINYGGVLSMTRDPVDIADKHAVLLQLHGVAVNSGTFEDAIAEWLKAARASLNEDMDT